MSNLVSPSSYSLGDSAYKMLMKVNSFATTSHRGEQVVDSTLPSPSNKSTIGMSMLPDVAVPQKITHGKKLLSGRSKLRGDPGIQGEVSMDTGSGMGFGTRSMAESPAERMAARLRRARELNSSELILVASTEGDDVLDRPSIAITPKPIAPLSVETSFTTSMPSAQALSRVPSMESSIMLPGKAEKNKISKRLQLQRERKSSLNADDLKSKTVNAKPSPAERMALRLRKAREQGDDTLVLVASTEMENSALEAKSDISSVHIKKERSLVVDAPLVIENYDEMTLGNFSYTSFQGQLTSVHDPTAPPSLKLPMTPKSPIERELDRVRSLQVATTVLNNRQEDMSPKESSEVFFYYNKSEVSEGSCSQSSATTQRQKNTTGEKQLLPPPLRSPRTYDNREKARYSDREYGQNIRRVSTDNLDLEIQRSASHLNVSSPLSDRTFAFKNNELGSNAYEGTGASNYPGSSASPKGHKFSNQAENKVSRQQTKSAKGLRSPLQGLAVSSKSGLESALRELNVSHDEKCRETPTACMDRISTMKNSNFRFSDSESLDIATYQCNNNIKVQSQRSSVLNANTARLVGSSSSDRKDGDIVTFLDVRSNQVKEDKVASSVQVCTSSLERTDTLTHSVSSPSSGLHFDPFTGQAQYISKNDSQSRLRIHGSAPVNDLKNVIQEQKLASNEISKADLSNSISSMHKGDLNLNMCNTSFERTSTLPSAVPSTTLRLSDGQDPSVKTCNLDPPPGSVAQDFQPKLHGLASSSRNGLQNAIRELKSSFEDEISWKNSKPFTNNFINNFESKPEAGHHHSFLTVDLDNHAAKDALRAADEELRKWAIFSFDTLPSILNETSDDQRQDSMDRNEFDLDPLRDVEERALDFPGERIQGLDENNLHITNSNNSHFNDVSLQVQGESDTQSNCNAESRLVSSTDTYGTVFNPFTTPANNKSILLEPVNDESFREQILLIDSSIEGVRKCSNVDEVHEATQMSYFTKDEGLDLNESLLKLEAIEMQVVDSIPHDQLSSDREGIEVVKILNESFSKMEAISLEDKENEISLQRHAVCEGIASSDANSDAKVDAILQDSMMKRLSVIIDSSDKVELAMISELEDNEELKDNNGMKEKVVIGSSAKSSENVIVLDHDENSSSPTYPRSFEVSLHASVGKNVAAIEAQDCVVDEVTDSPLIEFGTSEMKIFEKIKEISEICNIVKPLPERSSELNALDSQSEKMDFGDQVDVLSRIEDFDTHRESDFLNKSSEMSTNPMDVSDEALEEAGEKIGLDSMKTKESASTSSSTSNISYETFTGSFVTTNDVLHLGPQMMSSNDMVDEIKPVSCDLNPKLSPVVGSQEAVCNNDSLLHGHFSAFRQLVADVRAEDNSNIKIRELDFETEVHFEDIVFLSENETTCNHGNECIEKSDSNAGHCSTGALENISGINNYTFPEECGGNAFNSSDFLGSLKHMVDLSPERINDTTMLNNNEASKERSGNDSSMPLSSCDEMEKISDACGNVDAITEAKFLMANAENKVISLDIEVSECLSILSGTIGIEYPPREGGPVCLLSNSHQNIPMDKYIPHYPWLKDDVSDNHFSHLGSYGAVIYAQDHFVEVEECHASVEERRCDEKDSKTVSNSNVQVEEITDHVACTNLASLLKEVNPDIEPTSVLHTSCMDPSGQSGESQKEFDSDQQQMCTPTNEHGDILMTSHHYDGSNHLETEALDNVKSLQAACEKRVKDWEKQLLSGRDDENEDCSSLEGSFIESFSYCDDEIKISASDLERVIDRLQGRVKNDSCAISRSDCLNDNIPFMASEGQAISEHDFASGLQEEEKPITEVYVNEEVFRDCEKQVREWEKQLLLGRDREDCISVEGSTAKSCSFSDDEIKISTSDLELVINRLKDRANNSPYNTMLSDCVLLQTSDERVINHEDAGNQERSGDFEEIQGTPVMLLERTQSKQEKGYNENSTGEFAEIQGSFSILSDETRLREEFDDLQLNALNQVLLRVWMRVIDAQDSECSDASECAMKFWIAKNGDADAPTGISNEEVDEVLLRMNRRIQEQSTIHD